MATNRKNTPHKAEHLCGFNASKPPKCRPFFYWQNNTVSDIMPSTWSVSQQAPDSGLREGKVMKHTSLILLMASSIFAVMSTPACAAGDFQEFPIFISEDPLLSDQESPDVDQMYDAEGNVVYRVVWQQLVNMQDASGDNWHWDIYAADVEIDRIVAYIIVEYPTPNDPAPFPSHQQNPAVFGNKVAWQDDYYGNEDIYVLDMLDPFNQIELELTIDEYDQSNPAISGNTVVWQEETQVDIENEFGEVVDTIIEWDIWGADVTDPNYAEVYGINLYEANQQAPAIFRNNVVWQNDLFNDWDIHSTDVWMKDTPVERGVSLVEQIDQQAPAVWGNYVVRHEDTDNGQDIWAANTSDPENPVEFPICTADGLQRDPDIADNIIVWQDHRNDSWDIYGYNLTTGQEFQITDHPADQTNPAVSGNLVVWQDLREGYWSIYAAEFYGTEFTRCQNKPAADANNDCLVNINDLAIMAQEWLNCGLDQQGAACP